MGDKWRGMKDRHGNHIPRGQTRRRVGTTAGKRCARIGPKRAKAYRKSRLTKHQWFAALHEQRASTLKAAKKLLGF